MAISSGRHTRDIAAWTAEVTHNHPEGIKGAQAVAAAIFLARNGYPNTSDDELERWIMTWSEFNRDNLAISH